MIAPIIICHPKSLTRNELVEHCDYLQDAMVQRDKVVIALSHKLHEMNKLAMDISARLNALIDAYDENDREAITVQLNAMSLRRKSFKKPEVH